MTARVVVAFLVGVVLAALGALILGEYQFSGMLPWIAGPLFGVVIAEVMVMTGKKRSRLIGAIAGVLAAAGLLWAAWIASGEGLRPVSGLVWPAMGLAVVAAVLWTGSIPRSMSSPAPPSDR